ncbi:MAG: DUF262 domain-containing protein [Thermoflexibacter sp.]|jgi:uncharacterized protein with ParB-like and HNH nuclease domain|nr:DUF262 domain-containing protein [Thermoflexibacter sp.]
MSKIDINTRVRRLFNYINDFERGAIQIPPFQRAYVWNKEQKIQLLDSLKNGYPIGTILFWKPTKEIKEDLIDEEIQMIGSYLLEEKDSEFVYILDGYQRLSTLFGCFVDVTQTHLKRNENIWKKEFDIYYDLKVDKFELNRKTKTELSVYQVPLYQFVLPDNFYDFQTQLLSADLKEDEKKLYMQRYRDFGSKISTCDVASVDLAGGDVEQAVEIFSRLNSRGELISEDWKVSALTFNKKRNFRFGSEIDKVYQRVEKYRFFISGEERKKKRELILNCIINAFGVYFDQFSKGDYKKLEELCKKPEFIDITLKTTTAIVEAIKYFSEYLWVLDSKFLPYNNQLIFLTDFFNKVENPTSKQLETLKNWFWITTYANYFTRYNLSEQRYAYNKFQDFISNDNIFPIHYDKSNRKFETAKFPAKIDMGSVRAKALGLFMLHYQVKDEKLNIIEVNGYKTYRLFYECKNPNASENTILIIDREMDFADKRQKDLSDWLDSDNDYSKFFISKEMRTAYKDGKTKEEILAMRKRIIINAEKEFVESFNLIYIEE